MRCSFSSYGSLVMNDKDGGTTTKVRSLRSGIEQ
jgi:hypothetical protein